jgi:uncharacterized protein (TIGR03435 family)
MKNAVILAALLFGAMAPSPQDGPNSAYGPVFDVVSIRRNTLPPPATADAPPPSGYVRCRGIEPDWVAQPDPMPNVGVGGCGARGATVKELLNAAYGLRPGAPRAALDEIIVGGPAWAADAGFDIDAKMNNPSMATNEQFLIMLQNLLRDRFHLKFHREMRDVTGLALVRARGNHRLRVANASEEELITDPPIVKGQRVPVLALANVIAKQLGRVVLNDTGLDGFYDFTFTWPADPRQAGPAPGGDVQAAPPQAAPPQAAAAQESVRGASALAAALEEQLGLTLELQRVKWDVLVIDALSAPSIN